MFNQSFLGMMQGGGFGSFISSPLFLLLIVWTLVWKGLALWRAARKNSPIWFVVLLVVNTIGVLDILYYFFFADMGKKSGTHHHSEEGIHHDGEVKE